MQASLRYILQEVSRTVYGGNYDKDKSLKRWANQGVLLLNVGFTTELNKPGTHYHIWKDFFSFVLDTIVCNNPDIVYVFMGKVAQQWATLIPDNNYKILLSHPASVAYNRHENWETNNAFNKINEYLKKTGRKEITW